jgi:hypothetical protein
MPIGRLRAPHQQREQILAYAIANRQEWERTCARSRHLVITADTELRRRHARTRLLLRITGWRAADKVVTSVGAQERVGGGVGIGVQLLLPARLGAGEHSRGDREIRQEPDEVGRDSPIRARRRRAGRDNDAGHSSHWQLVLA